MSLTEMQISVIEKKKKRFLWNAYIAIWNTDISIFDHNMDICILIRDVYISNIDLCISIKDISN